MGKIELIYDGQGTVLMFRDGRPVKEFYCEHYLAPELEQELLCMLRYPPDPATRDPEEA